MPTFVRDGAFVLKDQNAVSLVSASMHRVLLRFVEAVVNTVLVRQVPLNRSFHELPMRRSMHEVIAPPSLAVSGIIQIMKCSRRSK